MLGGLTIGSRDLKRTWDPGRDTAEGLSMGPQALRAQRRAWRGITADVCSPSECKRPLTAPQVEPLG